MGSSSEKLESHCSTYAPDEGTVIAEAVDVWGKKRPHFQMTRDAFELGPSVRHYLLSNATVHRHNTTNYINGHLLLLPTQAYECRAIPSQGQGRCGSAIFSADGGDPKYILTSRALGWFVSEMVHSDYTVSALLLTRRFRAELDKLVTPISRFLPAILYIAR